MPTSSSTSVIVNIDIDWPVPTNIRTKTKRINNNYVLSVNWDVVSPNDPIFEPIGLPGYESVSWKILVNNKEIISNVPNVKLGVSPGCNLICLSIVAVYKVCGNKEVFSEPSEEVCVSAPIDNYCYNRKKNVTKTKNNVSSKMLYALAVKYPKIAKTQVFKF